MNDVEGKGYSSDTNEDSKHVFLKFIYFLFINGNESVSTRGGCDVREEIGR